MSELRSSLIGTNTMRLVYVALYLAVILLAVIVGYFIFYIVRGFDYLSILVIFASVTFLFSILVKALFPLNKAVSDFAYYSLGIIAIVFSANSGDSDRKEGEAYLISALTNLTFGEHITDIAIAERFWKNYSNNRSALIIKAREMAIRHARSQLNEINRDSCRYYDIRRGIVSFRTVTQQSLVEELHAVEEAAYSLRTNCLSLDFVAKNEAYKNFLNGDDSFFEEIVYFLPFGLSVLEHDQAISADGGSRVHENHLLGYLLVADNFTLLASETALTRIIETTSLIETTYGVQRVNAVETIDRENASLAFVSLAGWLPFVLVGLLSMKLASGKTRFS